MLNREEYINKIMELLAQQERFLDKKNAINLYDTNTASENFYRDLLNKIYNLNLVNLNHEKKNNKAIDLGDVEKKLAYQITSTVTREKINKTIKDFEIVYHKNDNDAEYDQLFIFFLKSKEPLKTKKGIISKFSSTFGFDVNKHLVDNKDLVKKISNFDISKIEEVYNFINKEIGEKKEITFNNELTAFEKLKEQKTVIKLCNKIKQKFKIELRYLGRDLIFDSYSLFTKHSYEDKIEIDYIEKIFEATYPKCDENDKELFYSILSNSIKEASKPRYFSFIKDIESEEDNKINDILEEIGSKYFYKIKFNLRRECYSLVLGDIWYCEEDKNFFYEYFKRLKTILDLIASSNGSKLKELFNNRLSMYDYVFILYNLLVVGDDGSPMKIKQPDLDNIKNYIDFSQLSVQDYTPYAKGSIYMIAKPYKDSVEQEIKYALEYAALSIDKKEIT